MSGRAWAALGLAAVAVIGIAFAVGMATAPDSEPGGVPAASGPRPIDLPQADEAAALPDLVVEAPVSEEGATSTSTESSEIGAEPVEAAPEETAPPVESAPSGGGESGGGGGGGEALEGEGL